MKLLRQFDFDKLESTLANMYREGMEENEVVASLKEHLMSNDDGQPQWMTVVDGFYRKAMEEPNEAERMYFITEAQGILLFTNAVM